MCLCWSLLQVSVSPMFRWSLPEVDLGKWFHLLGAPCLSPPGGHLALDFLLLVVTRHCLSAAKVCSGLAYVFLEGTWYYWRSLGYHWVCAGITCSWSLFGALGGHLGLACMLPEVTLLSQRSLGPCLSALGSCLMLWEVTWAMSACSQKSLSTSRK